MIASLSFTVHSNMQVRHLTWDWEPGGQNFSFLAASRYIDHISNCWDRDALSRLGVNVRQHILLPTVAGTVEAGMLLQSRVSQCVFCRSLSSNPFFFFFFCVTTGILSHSFGEIFFCVGTGWSIFQQFLILKLCRKCSCTVQSFLQKLWALLRQTWLWWGCCACVHYDITKGVIPELGERRKRSKGEKNWQTVWKFLLFKTQK